MKKKNNNNQNINDNVGVYGRYSSGNQREESIDAQNRAAEKYSVDNNLNIVDKYYDSASTGRNDKRPEFQRLIADVKKGNIKKVLVYKVSRFSRSLKDAFKYLSILDDNGAELISVTEPFINSALLKAIYFALAQTSSEDTTEFTLAGLIENCHQGMNTGGIPALGFDVDKNTKKFVVNEDEANTVRMIFSLYDEGWSYQQIIDKLNLMGKKTKKQKAFGKNSMHSILRNTKYVGIYTYNRCEAKKSDGSRNNSKSKPKEEIIVVEDVIPPIISQDLWDRVQTRLNGNYKISSRNNYLLSGIIFCSNGHNMSGNTYQDSKGNKFHAYRCHNKDCNIGQRKAEWVESFVLSELKRIVFNERQIPFLLEKMNELKKQSESNTVDHVKTLKYKIRGVGTKIDNLIEFISNGNTDKGISDRLEALREEERLLQNQLLEKEAKQQSANAEYTEETICKLFAKYTDFIKNNNLPACHNFIKTYVNKVVVSKENIDVEIVVPSVYATDYQQWLKMRTSLAIRRLKQPAQSSKTLRLADNTVVPLPTIEELDLENVKRMAQL